MAVVGRSARPLQLTLALLKPDAVAHPLVLEVRPGRAGPHSQRPPGPTWSVGPTRPGAFWRCAPPAQPLRLCPQAVHETILSNRFLIVRAKKLRCGREESRRFYREHAGRRARARGRARSPPPPGAGRPAGELGRGTGPHRRGWAV